MKAKGYARHARLQSDHLAGRTAIKVWVCRGCEMHHRAKDLPDGKKPAQCLNCGRMDFDEFPSMTEANRWASLRLLERAGEISQLRRQIWYDLMAYGPGGKPIRVGAYVADFVYVEDGETIISDAKPRSGIDDFADLKLKIMAANGRPVKIFIS